MNSIAAWGSIFEAMQATKFGFIEQSNSIQYNTIQSGINKPAKMTLKLVSTRKSRVMYIISFDIITIVPISVLKNYRTKKNVKMMT